METKEAIIKELDIFPEDILKNIYQFVEFQKYEIRKEQSVYPQLDLSIEQVKNGKCSKPYSNVADLINDLEA